MNTGNPCGILNWKLSQREEKRGEKPKTTVNINKDRIKEEIERRKKKFSY